jgi:tetratricopeptide (TPR) repeat protein
MCKSFGLETRLGTAQLLHHGYTTELVRDRNKVERNLRLLRLAIEERPDDVNLVLNLGLELVRSGEFEQGLQQYRRAYQLMSAQPDGEVVPELREVLLTQFTAQLYKAGQHDEVRQVLTSTLATNGGLTASLHFALGLAYHQLKQPEPAAEQMRQCLATRLDPVLSPINTDILGAAPAHCLALSLDRAGDTAGAEMAFRSALTENGCLDDVKVDFARFSARQGRAVDALHVLHELVAGNAHHAAAWRLGGELALSKPEFLEFACDWTGEAIRHLPDDAVVIGHRAEALLLSQQAEAAQVFWNRACHGARTPRAIAAAVLCAVVNSAPLPVIRGADEERAVSRAFIEWYQRLVSVRADETILELNSRMETLRESLPTASRLLDEAMVEATLAAP